MRAERPLRVLTWPQHGNYMYYLAQTPVEFVLPLRDNPAGGYGGRGKHLPMPDNVIEVPAEDVSRTDIDCILYQSPDQYRRHHLGIRHFVDEPDALSAEQQELPRLMVEHDPPRESPTDEPHVGANDPDLRLIHVTHYNRLMWFNGVAQASVIEHGVTVPRPGSWTGELERGVVIINNIDKRGRRLGYDLYLELAKLVPLDLVGMGSEELIGGVGSRGGLELLEFIAPYRFVLNPIRHTSLGLSLLEAMMVGLPPVAFATTEIPTVIEHGRTGYFSHRPDELTEYMRLLLDQRAVAEKIGKAASTMVQDRFNVQRFAADWLAAFQRAVARR